MTRSCPFTAAVMESGEAKFTSVRTDRGPFAWAFVFARFASLASQTVTS